MRHDVICAVYKNTFIHSCICKTGWASSFLLFQPARPHQSFFSNSINISEIEPRGENSICCCYYNGNDA